MRSGATPPSPESPRPRRTNCRTCRGLRPRRRSGLPISQDFGSQHFRQFDFPVERVAGRAKSHGAPQPQASRHDGGQGRSDAAQADHLRRPPPCIHHPRRLKVGFRIQAVEGKAFRRFGGDRIGERECRQAGIAASGNTPIRAKPLRQDARTQPAMPIISAITVSVRSERASCPRSANCASASPCANSPASMSAATRAAWRSIPAGIRPSLRNASPNRLMTSRGFSVRD